MSAVKSLNGFVLDGWERGRTGNGIPYYINHKDASTHWDHPEMSRLLEEMQKYNGVKYAAYRTAEKMRYIINALRLNLVRWSMIDRALLEHGYRFVCTDETLGCFKLEALLFTLCELGQTDTSCTGQSAVHAELLLNLLLNMFDKERKQGVNLVSATIVLGVLCSGRLLEKYKSFPINTVYEDSKANYIDISHQFIDRTNFIMKRHIQMVLFCLAKIPELFGEKLSFGSHLVPAALESCCQQNCGLSEEGFLEWLFREPQTLVWLPTYARLKAAELTIHPVRCRICKLYPIVGMRYCCLHCLRYDICQSCFFRGKVSKAHKLTHPMREHCQLTTSWDATKTLLKTLKNRLKQASAHRSKPSYLPISATDAALMENELQRNSSDADLSAKTKCSGEIADSKAPRIPTTLNFEHRRELESIIIRLEDENKHLSHEINRFHSLSENGSSQESRSSQGSWEVAAATVLCSSGANSSGSPSSGCPTMAAAGPLAVTTAANNTVQQHQQAPVVRDFQLARQELLEEHAMMMGTQIKRLRQLLQYLTQGEFAPSHPPDMPLPPIPPHQGSNNPSNKQYSEFKGGYPLESTPIVGRPHVPPHQWTPFLKLQSELEMLEQLTAGLQEASNTNGDVYTPVSSPNFFQGTRLRHSCRGVSFTDRGSGVTSPNGMKEPKSVTFQRQGSVRTTTTISPSFSAYWSNPTSSVYDNCSSSSNTGNDERPFSSNYFPSPNSQDDFEDFRHLQFHSCSSTAATEVKLLDSRRSGVVGQQSQPSRVDADLQSIIDQLEKVLPNSWSSAPSLLPEEKAKVLQAVTEVEEAMAQFLNCHSSKQQQALPPDSVVLETRCPGKAPQPLAELLSNATPLLSNSSNHSGRQSQ